MKIHSQVLVLTAMLALAGPGSPLAAQDKSWTGESVLPLKLAKDIKFTECPDGKGAGLVLSGAIPFTVREDARAGCASTTAAGKGGLTRAISSGCATPSPILAG